jgi:hypothetical protein
LQMMMVLIPIQLVLICNSQGSTMMTEECEVEGFCWYLLCSDLSSLPLKDPSNVFYTFRS